MKLEIVVSQKFATALGNISGVKLNAKLSYQVAKLLGKVEGELKNYKKARESQLKIFSKTKENGEFVIENNKHVFEAPEKEAEFVAEMSKLESIDIILPKISLKEIVESNVSIEPWVLEALDGVIEKDFE